MSVNTCCIKKPKDFYNTNSFISNLARFTFIDTKFVGRVEVTKYLCISVFVVVDSNNFNEKNVAIGFVTI